MFKTSNLALCAAVGLFAAGAGAARAQTPEAAKALTVAVEQTASTPVPAAVVPEAHPVIAAVRARLAEQRPAGDRDDRAALTAFYAEHLGTPLWMSGATLSPGAISTIEEIRRADDWGLRAADFVVPELSGAQTDLAALADAEITLGLAVLKYARHARGGRVDPSQLSRNLDQKPNLLDPKSVLADIAKSDAPAGYVRGLHPRHPQFEKLRQALLAMRGVKSIAAEKVSDIKMPSGPRLKPGEQHAHIALLRRRLGVTAEAGPETSYDGKLADAVKAFQQEHGQEPSGFVTNATRSALNGGTQPNQNGNAQKILINMERWRWMPSDLGAFYVIDNVPEFTTRVVKDGAVVHAEKIIVGKIDHQTPVFSADMQMIVFHPEWGVPDGIKVNEIAPSLRRSSGDGFSFFGGNEQPRILRQHNLRVSYNGHPVDASKIDWSKVDIRRYQFIQPAGGQNVLGVVKFRFPNKHDVYMHDTPQRELFKMSRPALSHGCMRVQNPRRLAEILLAEDKGWSAAHVGGLIASGRNNEVRLTKPIPVHVTYFTASVDDAGKLRTFDDLYGHDSRIASALEGKPVRLIAQSDPGAVAEREVRRAGKARKQVASGSDGGIFAGLFGN